MITMKFINERFLRGQFKNCTLGWFCLLRSIRDRYVFPPRFMFFSRDQILLCFYLLCEDANYFL